LRRSASVELAQALAAHGVQVTAFDPAVHDLPSNLNAISRAASLDEALAGADVAILATPWPEFRALTVETLVQKMRQPRLIDQAGFLPYLAGDPRLVYVRVGQPLPRARTDA